MAKKKNPNFKRSIKNQPLLTELADLADYCGINVYLVGTSALRLASGWALKEIELLVSCNLNTFFEALINKFEVEALWLEPTGAQFRINKSVNLIAYAYEEADDEAPDDDFTFEGVLKQFWFRVNAMAISLKPKTLGKLIDPFKGYADFEAGAIHSIGDAAELFNDHPLSMGFACYLAAEFGYALSDDYRELMKEYAAGLEEGNRAEMTELLFKVLNARQPSIGLIALYQTGLLNYIFPEAAKLGGIEQKNEYDHKDVFYHTCTVVDNTAEMTENVWVRFAALVHDIAKPLTKKFVDGTGWTFHGHEELGARMMKSIFKELELPPDNFRLVKKLTRLHQRPSALAGEEVTDSAVRRLITDAGEFLDELILLCRADITSKNLSKVSRFQRNYDLVEQRILEVKRKDELAAFQSPVRGEEIMKLCDLPPSRKVGVIKKAIEDAILSGDIENTYEAALRYLLDNQEELMKRAD